MNNKDKLVKKDSFTVRQMALFFMGPIGWIILAHEF